MSWIKRFFQMEEINGGERCPTYLFRWTLLRTRWGSLYLHHFVGDDWSRDLHDHPKRFVSIGLRGSYIEETEQGFESFAAPWVRTFPAEHKHRIIATNCWTMVWVGKPNRAWGFWQSGRFIPWREYVYGPDARPACTDDEVPTA